MLYCILVYAKLIFKKIVPSFNLSDKLAIPNFSRFFFSTSICVLSVVIPNFRVKCEIRLLIYRQDLKTSTPEERNKQQNENNTYSKEPKKGQLEKIQPHHFNCHEGRCLLKPHVFIQSFTQRSYYIIIKTIWDFPTFFCQYTLHLYVRHPARSGLDRCLLKMAIRSATKRLLVRILSTQQFVTYWCGFLKRRTDETTRSCSNTRFKSD